MPPSVPASVLPSSETGSLAPVTPARVLYHLFLGVAEADRLLAPRPANRGTG